MRLTGLLRSGVSIAIFSTDDDAPYGVELDGDHLHEFRAADRTAESTPVITASEQEAELLTRLDAFIEQNPLPLLEELRERLAQREPYFGNPVEAIDACEAELRRAMLASDVATLDRLLDERLVFGGLDGAVYSKQQDLGLHRSRRITIEQLDPRDRHVELHRDAAVVSVKMKAVAVLDGTRHENVLRYTRFWHRRDGAWRVIGGQLSALAS